MAGSLKSSGESGKMTQAFNLMYTLDEHDTELLGSLENHLAIVEEHLESIIRKAAQLPVEEQDEYWALASDLQREIRPTRKQIMAELQRIKGIPSRDKDKVM
jgi:hypothetical protein